MKYSWLWCILASIIVSAIICWLTDPDSWPNKKRFAKRLSKISSACWRLDVEEIQIENKGRIFNVRVVEGQRQASLSCRGPYSVTDIYINGELVCKLHMLTNLFTEYRTLEYVDNRSRTEIDEIVKKACRVSKQKLKEYYKSTPCDFGLKSFYKE